MRKKYIVKNVKDFNLRHTFCCGQCFRWEEEADGSFTGIAFGKPVNMKLDGGSLTVDNCTEEDFETVWRPYLDLDRDYAEIKKSLSDHDPVMGKAVETGSGIRILQQDLWETIVSFIISQNSNIPRIRGCISRLAELFGEKACTYREKEWFSLPDAGVLAGLTAEDLAPVRLGYRGRYLVETARQVAAEGLPRNKKELLALTGVGPKVADCVALFGMGQTGAFPIDVWVSKAMGEAYGIDEKDKKAMARYAFEHFGKLGGFAQQYLFYYIREKNMGKK